MPNKATGLALLFAAALLAAGCATGGGTAAPARGSGGARGPLTKGPEAVLMNALDNLTNDGIRGLGWAVATSGDGQESIITRPYIKGGSGSGLYSLAAAWVFEDGDDENSAANFYLDDAESTLYGGSCAMSQDGSFVVIGMPGLARNKSCAIYGYIAKSTGWKQAGQPVDQYPPIFSLSGASGSSFGFSVAVSGTGNTVVVGAPTENDIGLVHYYLAPAGGWRKVGKEVSTGQLGAGRPSKGAEFGHSVAISRDDSVIAIGAPGDLEGRGAVYVFRKPGKGGWPAVIDLLKVTLNDGKPGDRFGESVSINKDGSLIAVGADGCSSGGGAVFCVKYDWIADDCTTVRISGDSDLRGLGVSVAISADGKTIAAGGYGNARGGGVSIYRSTSGSWDDPSNIDNLTPKDGSKDMLGGFMGFSVALVDDGSWVLMGVPGYKLGSGEYYWIEIDK